MRDTAPTAYPEPGAVTLEMETTTDDGDLIYATHVYRSRDEIDRLIARLVDARVTAWPAPEWEEEDE